MRCLRYHPVLSPDTKQQRTVTMSAPATATTTATGQGAAIPTVIQCNPTGTSPPAGMRLTYFTETSADEVTAQLAQGSQPMLVGCTADTINLLVKVRQAHIWQARCPHLLTMRLLGWAVPAARTPRLDARARRRRERAHDRWVLLQALLWRVLRPDARERSFYVDHRVCGRLPVSQQCVCCVYLKVPANEMFLLCLEYVGDTTVEVVMECPRVRAALRERAAEQASQRGDRRPRLV